jgi:hypothetical protein
MRHMATRKKRTAEPAANSEPRPAAPQTSTILWIHDAPVCVEIVESPQPKPRDGVCRCAACHAAELADWAERFLRG